MNRNVSRYLATLVVVVAAVAVALLLYARYTHRPWTRDAQVRANIVGVAPRVAGPVVDISVRDNQAVKKGDPLFEIDGSLYEAAVDRERAAVAQAEAALTKSRQALARQQQLFSTEVNDKQDLENAQDAVAINEAELASAQASASEAELDLGYTKVVAPVNGYVTNMATSAGTYVQEGQELMALVDRDSFWVAAYFKETQLGHVVEGADAKVILLGHEGAPVAGEIESVSWGVARENGEPASDLLPIVSPTVDWVRLPQRFPVRVQLTGEPPVPLRIGQTASVVVGE